MPRLDEVTTQAYNRAAPTAVTHRGLALGAGGGVGATAWILGDEPAFDTGGAGALGGVDRQRGYWFTTKMPLTLDAVRFEFLPNGADGAITRMRLWDKTTQTLLWTGDQVHNAGVWSTIELTEPIALEGSYAVTFAPLVNTNRITWDSALAEPAIAPLFDNEYMTFGLPVWNNEQTYPANEMGMSQIQGWIDLRVG